MNERQYKLNILKDILKFSSKTLTTEERDILLSSALFQDKSYFTSAALLVKKEAITMDDVINLAKLEKSELPAFLTPTEDSFDYFAKISPDKIMQALTDMEDYLLHNPIEALENRQKNEEQILKIKALAEAMKRG